MDRLLRQTSLLIFLASIVPGGNCLPAILQVPQTAWVVLNRTIGGALHLGRPEFLPCFTSYSDGERAQLNTPDLSACITAGSGRTDGPSIASYFGGYEVPNWGQCQANATTCSISAVLPASAAALAQTCYQGSVPSYYIDSPNPEHMHAGIVFARQHAIPLVVKNTGHDHRGRSSAPYSLAIWTHNIQPNIIFNNDFRPTGCSSSTGFTTMTYGAGYEFGSLYDAAHTKGHMLAGGAALSVGASGGWVQGGGHGVLSPTYGIGVDNVMEMTALLPNGSVITANRCQNQDLFFALRGGGGGTFGIVLNTTSHIYPEVPMQYASIAFGHLGADLGSDFFKILIDHAEALAADGWGAYILPGALEGTVASFGGITPKLSSVQEAKKSLSPIINFAKSLTNLTVPLQINITTVPHGYYDFLQTSTANTVGGFTGLSYALVSRLVPRANFRTKESRAKLLHALNQMNTDKLANPNLISSLVPFYILMVPPFNFDLPASDQPGGPGYASVTPAWRDALWQFEMPTVWDPVDRTAGGAGSVSQAFTDAHTAINPLRKITQSSGAYQNEADIFEPDHATAFWGAKNYQRLMRIKQEVDPDNVLTCHQCIGWDPLDQRYRCYPTDLSSEVLP